jgi:erythromycin esterase-like protein
MSVPTLAGEVVADAIGAIALDGSPRDHDVLLEMVADRRLVLLGEASHGTHEFYAERARITRRLIEECGFDAVAVEADWPDARRVDRYVVGQSSDDDAPTALADFRRFPAWMWRNRDVADFVEWLRRYNDASGDERAKVRFFGLDLYSLRTSMEAVVAYLDGVDPDAARAARARYSCFDHLAGEGLRYGRAVALRVKLPCEDEVITQLVDLHRRRSRLLAGDGWIAEDDFFAAEQNARLVRNAEEYYRLMYHAEVSSWNLRDRHMSETLDALVAHLDRQVGRSKVVVWEHNSHVGDARATQMGAAGELNVGQLTRTTWRDDCLLVGFTTHHGTVTAASEWGGPAERKIVRPAPPGSFEDLFHASGRERFIVLLGGRTRPVLHHPMLERAIGVIYRPQTERSSHWFRADLARQFDAVIHIDGTTAVEPLERTARWDEGEPPETYPTGL